MSCLRVWDSNWADSSVAANIYYSSEKTTHPASNAYNLDRRARVWRSAGYWNIVSGSNTIVFRESVGVDLTATITVGEYATTADLLTEIKTQLEAVGASTYTVSLDTTTSKFKILSDLSGGGGIFQLIWTSATGFGTTIGFDTSADDTGAAFYIADLLRIHTEEFFIFDLGIASNPKAFALLWDRNIPTKFSATATVRLQGNTTNSWASPAYDQTVTVNDYIVALEDKNGLHTSGLRYWRVYMQDVDNPIGYLEIGAIYIGDSYSPTRGAAQFPFATQLQDRSTVVYSESGQTYTYKRPKYQTFDISWAALKKDELESLEDFANQVGTHDTFIISFDSLGAFSTVAETWIRAVKLDQMPEFSLVSPNNFQMVMRVREEL